MEVHGVIRDRDGVGVEGVDVCFDPTDDDRSVYWCQRTNRMGAFRMWVRPARYRPILRARHVRVPDVDLETMALTLPSNELNYRYGGIRIVGRLLGPGGKPVQSGSVEALGSGPDRRGFYVESKFSEGHYTLFVPPTSYYFKTRPMPAYLPSLEGERMGASASSDTTIDFSADGHLITGKVTIRNGIPLPSADVEVYGLSLPDSVEVSARNTTKSDGSYRFCLPAGGYAFIVRPGPRTRFVLPRTLSVEVTAPRTNNLDLSGVEWTGIVRDSVTGSPLKSVAVTATITLGNGAYRYVSAASVSDGKGRFRLVLESGRTYLLSLSKADGRIAPKEVWGMVAGSDSTFDVLVRTSAP